MKGIRLSGLLGLGENLIRDGHHAVRADNIALVRGTVGKRHGMEQIAAFPGAVDAVVPFVLEGKNHLLVYAGLRYWVGTEGGAFVDVSETATVAKPRRETWRRGRVQGFVAHGRLYLVGGGEYLTLEKKKEGWVLAAVEDAPETYVPTTSIAIGAKESAVYVETTPDESVGGSFWVADGSGYAEVVLDENNPPQEGVQYYRRVLKPDLGRAHERPNMMSSYRKNSLYGTDSSAVFQLDATDLDSDSETTIAVTVAVGEKSETHFVLRESEGAEVLRAPEMNEDLGGRQLEVQAGTVSGVGPLNLLPIAEGHVEWTTDKGVTLLWTADGGSSEDWDRPKLVLRTGEGETLLAEAVRGENNTGYTVSYLDVTVTLPADAGAMTYRVASSAKVAEHVWLLMPKRKSTFVRNGMKWAELDYVRGQLTFLRPTTPPGLEDNILVTFKKRSENYHADRINAGRAAVLWGVRGGSEYLFVAGESPSHVDYHSAMDDWTYFPDINTSALGPEGGRIVGYMRLPDGRLATFLEAPGENLFVREGTWVESTVAVSEENTVASALFVTVGGLKVPTSMGDGAVVGSEYVFVSREGVYALVNYAINEERHVRCRSNLLGRSMKRPLAWTVRGSLLAVSDGECVWVADSTQKTRLVEDSYEWVRWTLDQVGALAVSEGRLVLGRNDGTLLVETEGYEDLLYRESEPGQVTLAPIGVGLVVDPFLRLAVGNRVLCHGELWQRLPQADFGEGLAYLDSESILEMCEGETLAVRSPEGEVLLATVGEVDFGRCCFALLHEGTPYTPQARSVLLRPLEERELVATAVDDGTARLSLRTGGMPITLDEETWTGVACVRVVQKTAVEAVWQSGEYDMGRPEWKKLLLSVSSVTGNVERGTLRVHCGAASSTWKTGRMRALDYRWLDFLNLSYGGKGLYTHTKKVKLRFHFFGFEWRACGACDEVLHELIVKYEELNVPKGVSV